MHQAIGTREEKMWQLFDLVLDVLVKEFKKPTEELRPALINAAMKFLKMNGVTLERRTALQGEALSNELEKLYDNLPFKHPISDEHDIDASRQDTGPFHAMLTRLRTSPQDFNYPTGE